MLIFILVRYLILHVISNISEEYKQLAESINKRADERKFFSITFDYTFSSLDDESSLKCGNALGVSSNRSEHGLGFFTSRILETGQPIIIYHNTMFDQPVSAEVRWCMKQSESLFKVGVSFN